LKFYGFNTPAELFGNWQYTMNELDETLKSYKEAIPAFESTFNILMYKFLEKLPKLRQLYGNLRK